MIMTLDSEKRLPQQDMAELAEEVRGASRKLSREQMLDLADMLHDLIRERQFEMRTQRRLNAPVAERRH